MKGFVGTVAVMTFGLLVFTWWCIKNIDHPRIAALESRVAALESPACSHAACHAMGKAPQTEGDGR